MCLFRSSPPTPISTPAPIQPRQPDLVKESQLPSSKELLDPDEVAGVEYGTSQRKKDPVGTAKRTGTDALKINLNPGAGTADTGGLKIEG
tara:strand:+ start:78 stop:347 length:270 start_codon:yes stop_codon:yes gene_type:complete